MGDNIENYNLLISCLFRDYENELSRKGRLDSKVSGYFAVLGIFMAAFLMIEPLLIEKIFRKNICICLICLDLFIVIVFIVLFYMAFKLLIHAYEIKKRNEIDIIEKWDELKNKPYSNNCNSIKIGMAEPIKDLKNINDSTMNSLKGIGNIFIAQSILVFICLIIYICTFL